MCCTTSSHTPAGSTRPKRRCPQGSSRSGYAIFTPAAKAAKPVPAAFRQRKHPGIYARLEALGVNESTVFLKEDGETIERLVQKIGNVGQNIRSRTGLMHYVVVRNPDGESATATRDA